MSVPQEVVELRVKVAELENDLWRVRSQRDAAVASTETLVQVVSNLTTPRGENAVPRPTERNDVPQPRNIEHSLQQHVEREEQFKQLTEKYERLEQMCNNLEAKNEARVKILQEYLDRSEKLRKDLQVLNRRLAGKRVDVDEEINLEDNKHDSSRESGREAKRCNRGAPKHSRVCSSSPSRGRSLVRSETTGSRNAEVVARAEAPQPVPSFSSLPFSFLVVPTPAPTPAPLASLASQTSEEDKKAAAWAVRKKAAVEEAERKEAALEAERKAAAVAAALKAEEEAVKRAERNRLMKIKTDALIAKRVSEAQAQKDAATKSVDLPMGPAITKAAEHSSTSTSGIPPPVRKVTWAEEEAFKKAAADRDLAERMKGLMQKTEAEKEAAYNSSEMPIAPAFTDLPFTKILTAPASTKAVEHPSTPPLVSPPSVVESVEDSKVEVLQKKRGNLIPLADFLAEVDGPMSPPMTFERVPKPVAPSAPVGVINYGEGFVVSTTSGPSTLTSKEEEAPSPVAPPAPSLSEPVAPPASSGRPIIIYLDDEGKEKRFNYEDDPDFNVSDESGDESDTPLILPQPPISDKLKAIDTHATNDWEDSDDEDDVVEAAPVKSLPKTDRAIRLLGQCEEPEVDLNQLIPVKFFVPEPGTVFKTGLDMAVHTNPKRVMDQMKSEFDDWQTPAAFQHGPNKNLFGCEDDVFLACRHGYKQEKVCRDFFTFGLFHSPASGRRDVFRTVHLGNLPAETTIGDLMRRVRGGMVISAQLLDTMKLMGSNSALVIFVEATSAAKYVEFSNKHPITFGSNNDAIVTLVGTPTYPASAGVHAAIHRRGRTRCIQIPGCPTGYLDQEVLQALPKDLATLWSRDEEGKWNKVAYEHRVESMEEPYIASETLHLSFSSVSMADSVYGILTAGPRPKIPRIGDRPRTKYDDLGLSPRFVEDVCAGELGELLTLPPMEFERMANSEPTALQNLRASFKRRVNTPAPVVGDQPVDSFMPEPQAESELTDDSSSTPDQEPASDETAKVPTGKRQPLMITASAYRQLFSKLASEAAPAIDILREGSVGQPVVITGEQYDGILHQYS